MSRLRNWSRKRRQAVWPKDEAEERVRRIRAGEAFDPARFEAVVELVMTKLRSLDEDGSES